MTTVWITKYALTEGILEVDAQIAADGKYATGPFCLALRMGKDAYISYEDAIARAYKMREAKAKSLEKQLAKLKSFRFLDVKRATGEKA